MCPRNKGKTNRKVIDKDNLGNLRVLRLILVARLVISRGFILEDKDNRIVYMVVSRISTCIGSYHHQVRYVWRIMQS